jgi:hypothetical protein
VKLQEQIYGEAVPAQVKRRVGRLLDDVLVGDLESIPVAKITLDEEPVDSKKV